MHRDWPRSAQARLSGGASPTGAWLSTHEESRGPSWRERVVFPHVIVSLTSEFPSAIVTSFGLSLAVYALVLLSALFVEDFIFFLKERHEQVSKAFADARKDLF